MQQPQTIGSRPEQGAQDNGEKQTKKKSQSSEPKDEKMSRTVQKTHERASGSQRNQAESLAGRPWSRLKFRWPDMEELAMGRDKRLDELVRDRV